jgi:hypothetical protein
MTPRILLPIKKLPDKKIWVYRYAFTHTAGNCAKTLGRFGSELVERKLYKFWIFLLGVNVANTFDETMSEIYNIDPGNFFYMHCLRG